jgi:hypothetical protein
MLSTWAETRPIPRAPLAYGECDHEAVNIYVIYHLPQKYIEASTPGSNNDVGDKQSRLSTV